VPCPCESPAHTDHVTVGHVHKPTAWQRASQLQLAFMTAAPGRRQLPMHTGMRRALGPGLTPTNGLRVRRHAHACAHAQLAMATGAGALELNIVHERRAKFEHVHVHWCLARACPVRGYLPFEAPGAPGAMLVAAFSDVSMHECTHHRAGGMASNLPRQSSTA
jgi:hypothetical protein